MPTLLRIILALPLLGLLGFCIFGFLATFEPGPGAIAWRVGYSVAGLACIAGLLWLALARREAGGR